MIIVKRNQTLHFHNKIYRCAFGLKGLTNNKTEGDKMTPIGTFNIGNLYVRTDKIKNLKANLKINSINKNMAWCDNPKSKHYNKLITTSKPHTESLYRNDNIYDIVLVIQYNVNPIIPYKGSAIFIHNSKKNYEATNGCIALETSDLSEIIKKLKPSDKITITN